MLDGTNLPQGSINLNTASPTLGRTTSNMNFASQLKNAMGQGLAASSRGLRYVSPVVPGGAVLSAMLGDAANLALNGTSTMTAGPGIGGSTPDFMKSVESMQQSMASSNMQMISLQENSQRMNIHFSTLSNIMKAEHDMKKNSISNIR